MKETIKIFKDTWQILIYKSYGLEILLFMCLWVALDLNLADLVNKGKEADKVGIIIIVIASVFYIKKYLLKDKK